MRKQRTRGIVYNDAMRMAFALAVMGVAIWYDPLTMERMRDADLKDTCKDQLVQIGKGLGLYMRDNMGRFPSMPMYPMRDYPPSRLKLLALEAPPNLLKLLRSHIRNDEVFACPSAPDAVQQWDLCYLWNDALNWRARAGMTPAEAAATWMVADLESLNAILPVEHLAAYQMTRDMVPAPHVRGYNILYCDGAVRWSASPPRIKVANIPRLPAFGAPLGGLPGGAGSGSGGGSGSGS